MSCRTCRCQAQTKAFPRLATQSLGYDLFTVGANARWSLRRRIHRCSTGTASPSTRHSTYLDWLVERCAALPVSPKAVRCYLGGELGWGLVASVDIEADEVLLSLPLASLITTKGTDDVCWGLPMALQLLQEASLGPASRLDPWIAALPSQVTLPWLPGGERALAAVSSPAALAECERLRGMYETACQVYSRQHTPEQLAWALSMVYSRSFTVGGAHFIAPGIDFCNHSPQPCAHVHLVHSPNSCQGLSAVEDVCLPPPPEPSRFVLVAGEDGVRAGTEVTISYGSWASDFFLTYFGFDPHSQEADVLAMK